LGEIVEYLIGHTNVQQNVETGEIEVVKGRKEEQCERTAEYE